MFQCSVNFSSCKNGPCFSKTEHEDKNIDSEVFQTSVKNQDILNQPLVLTFHGDFTISYGDISPLCLFIHKSFLKDKVFKSISRELRERKKSLHELCTVQGL